MTAMEIYQEDRQNRKNPGARLPRQEYFSLLRDTLHDELMRQGHSDFLDAMLAECAEGKALPMLEFSALRECYEMIVENRPMQDASEMVPHIFRTATERFRWCDLGNGAYRVDNPETPQLLTRLQSVSRQLVSVRDETLAPDVKRAAQREVESMMAMNRALEAENARLRKERDDMRERIARLEEGIITDQLRQRVEVRCQQAEAEWEQELRTRREEAEARFHQELAGAAEQQHLASMASNRAAEEQITRRAEAHEALRQNMRREVEEMQARLSRQLTLWQEQAFAADHRFLASSCAGLIAAAHQGTARLMAWAEQQENAAVLLPKLAAWQAALDTQARQLETALQQLGMRLFWPEEGDAFDARLHSPAAAHAELDAAHCVISRTEVPGVMLTGRDADSSEALVRAVVQVRPSV